MVSGIGGNVAVTWKEFGVRLKFTPTIAGDVIRLQVRPEVSALDFTNGITLSGFRIPALSTRYAQTEVELRDGQTFAIAGLLDTMARRIAPPFRYSVVFQSSATSSSRARGAPKKRS